MVNIRKIQFIFHSDRYCNRGYLHQIGKIRWTCFNLKLLDGKPLTNYDADRLFMSIYSDDINENELNLCLPICFSPLYTCCGLFGNIITFSSDYTGSFNYLFKLFATDINAPKAGQTVTCLIDENMNVMKIIEQKNVYSKIEATIESVYEKDKHYEIYFKSYRNKFKVVNKNWHNMLVANTRVTITYLPVTLKIYSMQKV